MKKLLTLGVLLLLAGAAFANPPSIGAVSYDPATQLLTVPVSHDITKSPVKDPTKHYVKELTVTVDGALVLTQDFTFQESDKGLTGVYRLVLKSGSQVGVKVVCSLRGEDATTFTVP